MNPITSDITGRDHYDAKFRLHLEEQAKWLAIGAKGKADSIEILVKPHLPHPDSVLELGAGTGAIIAELRRRGFGQRFTAVDFSEEACGHMRRTLEGVEVHQADIVTATEKQSADVVIVSHVVEHLEKPDEFLAGVVKNVECKWLVIECPLEDLFFSRVKNRFRNRLSNLAGHVQFYTPASLRAQIGRHMEIVDARHYVSYCTPETLRFLAKKDKWGAKQKLFKPFTMGLLPWITAPLWKRLWVGNYAMLCRLK